MNQKISLSIIVPAYNEEKNIKRAVEGIIRTVSGTIKDYEILILNDGSTDRTGKEADSLQRKYAHVRAIHLKSNQGLGSAIQKGIHSARKEYITAFHGDNDANPHFLRDFIEQAKSADILSIYPRHSTVRSKGRIIVSGLFHVIMRTVFGVNLRYYNGTFLCKKSLLEHLRLMSRGFTIYAEIKIRLVKRGYTIQELPFENVRRLHGQSKAINLRSMIDTVITFFYLIGDVNIFRRP